MGLTQLINTVVTDSGFIVATVAPEVTSTTEGPDWIPVWAVLIGGLIGIGGSALTHILSTRNETKRLTAQHAREDKRFKREELKVLYADFIRQVDEYHLFSLVSQSAESVSNESERVEAEESPEFIKETLTKTATISSTLQVIELVGDPAVYNRALAYFGSIVDFDTEETTTVEAAQVTRGLLKEAMRASLE